VTFQGAIPPIFMEIQLLPLPPPRYTVPTSPRFWQ
jgi:hypothetical protein